MTIAKKIKSIVDARGIKYTALARASGVTIDAISKSFNGKRRLTAEELVAICKVLHIGLDDVG